MAKGKQHDDAAATWSKPEPSAGDETVTGDPAWPKPGTPGAGEPTLLEALGASVDVTLRCEDAQATRRQDAGPSPGEATDPEQPLGRYPVTGLLGQGGMGRILRVDDLDLGRELAAKVMLAQSGEAPLEKFLQEAKITGQLEHPNIVPVHELGVASDGRVYFTMQRVRGQTLQQVLAAEVEAGSGERAASLSRLLRIFLKVCDALSFAHSRNVIHRDIKPANIMVGAHGEVLVMDWGLAKIVGQPDRSGEGVTLDRSRAGEGEGLRTLAGTIMGTPAYMSPEQAAGEIEKLDARSDIYALGAVLYEMLANEPPFGGGSAWEIISEVSAGNLVPPSRRSFDKLVPFELEAVVLRAMARDRAERYQTVDELRAELERFLSGHLLETARYTPFQVVANWARRHLAAVIAAVAAVLIGIVATGVAFVHVSRERDRADLAAADARTEREAAVIARAAAVEARDAAQGALGAEEAARRAAVSAERDNRANMLAFRARQSLTLRRYAEARIYAAAAREAATTPMSRAVQLGLPPVRMVLDHASAVSTQPADAIGGTRDGRMLIIGSWDRRARIFDARTGQQTRMLMRHAGGVGAVAISPNGLFAFTAGKKDKLTSWQVGSARRLKTFEERVPNRAHVTAIDCSPSGRYLLSGDSSGAVRLWLIQTARLFRLRRLGRKKVRAVLFSDDGRQLVAAAGRVVGLWEMAGRGNRVHTLEHSAAVLSIALSADGRHLLAGLADRSAVLWDTETGKQLRQLHGHARPVASVGFTKDGRSCLTGSHDQYLRVWDTATGELTDSLRCWGAVRRIALSGKDGLMAASVVGRVRMALRHWRIGDGRPDRRLVGHEGVIRAIAIATDGQLLVTSDQRGKVRIWDTATGRTVQTLGHATAVGAVTLSGDGRFVLTGSGDAVVRVWDVSTGKPAEPFGGHARRVTCLARCGAERVVSGALDGKALVWRFEGREVVHTLDHGRVLTAVAATPDGSWIATAGEGQQAKLWDARTGQLVHTLRGHAGTVVGLAFSPSGEQLLTVSTDQTLRTWDVATGAQGRRLLHTAPLVSAGYAGDDRTIVAGDTEGQITLWDGRTRMRLAAIHGHKAPVSAIATTPDGRLVLSGALDRTARLWGLDAPSSTMEAERASGLRLDGISLVPLDRAAFEARKKQFATPGRPLWR